MLLYGTRKQNKKYSVSNASGIFFSNGLYGIRSRPRKTQPCLPWTTPFSPPSSLFPLILVADFSLTRLVGAIYYRVRGAKQKANLMYRFINNLAQLISVICLPQEHRVTDAKKKLMLQKPRSDYLKRSFSYSAAILWNNLPEEIRTSKSLVFIKRSFHRWFSDQSCHTENM